MHGHIGTIAMQLNRITNRKGRKRKSGRRTLSGALARKPVDYATMAGNQPHRSWLPEPLRTSEKASTVLGCLNLIRQVSDEEYEAGRRYSVIVGAYLAMANAPRGMAGAGRGYDCVGSQHCPAETCICLARTDRFMRAYEAISESCDRKAHLAVNRVAVQDSPCQSHEMDDLRCGLSALAVHFGLTTRRKSDHARNTNSRTA